MNEKILKEQLKINGSLNKPITFDINFKENISNAPVIIFSHGFKGFKDWGTFNLLANEFSKRNFFFLKFNFSHNGTTPEMMDDLNDFETFGNNNFEKEMYDLDCILNWLCSTENLFKSYFDKNEIYLIGHSRGGGISMLKAVEDNRVKKVSAWATINDFEKYMYLSDIENWEKTGVSFIENTRTGKQMPLYYQFYKNFVDNKKRFELQHQLMKLDKPILIIHGTADSTVDVSDAEWIYNNIAHSILIKIENADHTFDSKHPWDKNILPKSLKIAIEETIEFFNC
ncbi:MAG: prolyl oligopeptidase family serine peptidase [Bacteroidia bacterium]|nr:prolyl oligopeptidase family serine peptidase [Bacteroidia bacterium]